VKRVLVLGSGGVAGIAWATGVCAGLARAGANVALADGFLGTSAGSVVAAQIALDVPVEQLLASQLDEVAGAAEKLRPFSLADAYARNRALMEKVGGDLVAARQRIGAFALRADTVPVQERRAIIAARLPHPDCPWPGRWLGMVAVDAETGEHRVWDSHSGVPLVDAMASSCAVPGSWPVVRLNGRPYMDGGIRSGTNADLVESAHQVLVIAPQGYGDDNPVSGHLRAELRHLQGLGCRVDAIVPDEASTQAMGDNVLDPARRVPSAHAGLHQGLELGPALASAWGA